MYLWSTMICKDLFLTYTHLTISSYLRMNSYLHPYLRINSHDPLHYHFIISSFHIPNTFFLFVNKIIKMSSFESNLLNLKKYNTLILNEDDKKNILNLIELNDYNLEYEKVDQKSFKDYLKIRRSLLNKVKNDFNVRIDKHLEALRRKNALLSIKEEARQLITLNQYISHLVEEKKGPIDTLLTNLEYSEIYLNEATTELEQERERKRRCKRLKTVGKIVLCLGVVVLMSKVWYWIK